MKYLVLFVFGLVFNHLHSQCLNGNYNIGGLTPDYNSFQEAFDALEANGVCGPTLFYVHGGTYNEQAVLESFSNSSFFYLSCLSILILIAQLQRYLMVQAIVLPITLL